MSFFKKLSATEGFTLVELMVAVGIMTIAFVGLATMQVTTINGNAIANHVTTGITLAQDKMEELNSLDFNDPELNDNNTANNGNLRDARDDFTVVGTIASADDGHRETGIDESGNPGGMYNRLWNVADNTPIAGQKTIVVIVTWKNHAVTTSSIVQ